MATNKKVKQEKLWSVKFFLSDVLPYEGTKFLKKKEIMRALRDISFDIDGLSISLVKVSYLGKG